MAGDRKEEGGKKQMMEGERERERERERDEEIGNNNSCT